MGNLFSQQQQTRGTEAVWNIPTGNADSRNDLNRPHSAQIKDMILQFAVPFLCIAALQYNNRRGNLETKKQLAIQKEEHDRTVETYQQKLAEKYDNVSQSHMLKSMKVLIDDIEKREDKKVQRKHVELKTYEKGLERVLDIKCSMFRGRQEREQLQDQLVEILPQLSLQDTVKYGQLKEIYNTDGVFCGASKEENGKLRFLYVRQWKLQMERDKYKSIVEELKRMPLPSEYGR